MIRDIINKRQILKLYDFFVIRILRCVSGIKLFYIRKKYNLEILTTVETIQYIKKTKCSIARFGDGEFSIMLGKNGPHFQKESPNLSLALQQVFENKSTQLLICVPYFLKSTRELNDEARRFWRVFALNNQKEIVKLIGKTTQKNYVFGDSYVSRPFTAYRNNKSAEIVFPLLKDLWEGNEVLFVEGAKTCLGVGNDLFNNANIIRRIIVPPENAFDKYDEILDTVVKVWNGELVILAIGPVATILASDLSSQGIWALDLGHIDIQYEWFVRGEAWKPIPGKYTNEAINGTVVEECNDSEYLNQIVAVVN